jgi:large subunit ribosomal protein L24
MAANSKRLQHNSIGEERMPVKDPGKQRKQLFNAPAHLRHKLMAAPLSSELAASKGAKTLPVRKGDTVRVMRGDHKGFEGKINRVDLQSFRIFIEGLTREKVDGTAIFVSVHPSKVMIKNVVLDDKWRKRTIERKAELPKKEEKVVKKQPAKVPAKAKAVKEKPVEAETKVPVKVEAAKKPSPVPAKVEVAKPEEQKPASVTAKVEVEKPVEKKVEAAVKIEEEKPAVVAAKAPTKVRPARKRKEAKTEEKPKELRPTEAKPVEAKPVEEKKAVEEKPVAKKSTARKAKAPAKETPARKAPAKRKPKAEKEEGGA